MVLDPGMLDFDILRTGLTRSMEVTVRNDGSGECALRSVSVQRDSGPEENTYTVTRGLEGDVLAPRSAQTIEVTYAPTVANPLGDRSTLRVAYHDAERGLNLAQEALLRGQGATALVGALPEELVFVRTTAPDCASPPLTVDAANVGFVPICLTGYDREGDGCPSFVFVDPPAIDACHALDRDEALPLQLVFQPSAPGEVTCDIIVRSDAQNTEALHIPLRGEGVAEAATVDTHLVPMLDARNPARFSLSRPAVERTVRVFEDDALNEDWDFDAQRNAVSFPRGRHPAEGATLRIEYDAICFDRR
ncbi:MAG: hypothetical protein KC583_22930 [Myxococcales bacterium]|nr:hypothetical protein [Myxococcales bacterium]